MSDLKDVRAVITIDPAGARPFASVVDALGGKVLNLSAGPDRALDPFAACPPPPAIRGDA